MKLRARTASARNSSNLINVNSSGYSYAFIVPEGETSYTFKASDMDLAVGDSFTVGDIPSLDFTDGIESGVFISQDKDNDILVSDENGYKTYEKFFSINVDQLVEKYNLTRSNIVILNNVTGSGSGGTNFGLIDQFGNDERIDGTSTILDLTDEDTIYIYMYMEIVNQTKPWTFELHFVNPRPVTGVQQDLVAPAAYLFTPSDKPRIVEITGNRLNNNLDLAARYGIDGQRHPWFFEISRDNGYLINLDSNIEGYENEDIIFSYPVKLYENNAKISVRDVENGDPTPTVIDPHNPPKSIILNDGQNYLPIVFKTSAGKDLIGMNVEISEYATGYTVNVVAGHTDGVGSSTRVLGEDGRLKTDCDNSDILEYAYIERNGGLQEEITLEFFEYDPSQGGKN